ncbi:MAG: type IV secretion system DNA-binding domain-containing protein, partial [Candidatus Saccharimonadales bacterium]
GNAWHKRGESYINNLREGKGSGGMGDIADSLSSFLKNFLKALWSPPEHESSGNKEVSDHEKALITAANEKIGKLGYEVKIRFMHIGNDKNVSRLRIQSLVGAFKQFNATSNGFKVSQYLSDSAAVEPYQSRLFVKKGHILNIEELATLYHLPHKNVETPSMVWATTKTAEPPSNLPTTEEQEEGSLSPVAQTNFRGNHLQFGLKRSDRGRHVYIVGQTGTGKSGLLQLLTFSDIFQDQGFAIIDPHGDYATELLRYIPEHRIKDVVYFNPTDTAHPMAFNPLEVTDESLKGHISSEIVGVLKRMFGYSWGPRLEYILRYTILALLDYPNSTLLGITRMLTEKDFRKSVIKEIKDPVVKSFWNNEFASWNEKFANEAVAPILNKVGAFTANPLVRNIVGQPKSAFDIRKIMDEGKILIVNLSRGQVGEDNAATLGALMVTKIQLAAMSRANLATIEERRPFYLYVDEFQNFATDSFAVILSEARKYGLYLTIANQYVAQLTEEVRDAVFGNVGTMIMFRVGADEAHYLAKYIAPTFEPVDLMNLHTRHFITAMMIDGEKVAPFTGTTLEIPKTQADHTQTIIENSIKSFATDKATVEKEISRWASLENNSDTHRTHKNTPKSPYSAHRNAKTKQNDTNSKSSDDNNELKPDESIKLR